MILLGLALFAIIMPAQTDAATNPPIVTGQLTTNFLNAGASLYLASYGALDPIESQERLLLVSAGKRVAVNQLSDLKSAVHVDNTVAALQYVRLRTSPATWYLWHDRNLVEIVDTAAAGKLPNYGVTTGVTSHVSSGFMGILSSAAFKQGGFSTAVVNHAKSGFEVKRWLLGINSGKETVELVQEKVGFDGSYDRVVLQSKPAPKLSGTDWYIMKFE